VGSVNFVGDAVSNSIIRTVTNAGTDVLMTTGTTTTCGAVLQIVDPDLVIMIIVLLKPVLLHQRLEMQLK
jgi:hypothetical protein